MAARRPGGRPSARVPAVRPARPRREPRPARLGRAAAERVLRGRRWARGGRARLRGRPRAAHRRGGQRPQLDGRGARHARRPAAGVRAHHVGVRDRDRGVRAHDAGGRRAARTRSRRAAIGGQAAAGSRSRPPSASRPAPTTSRSRCSSRPCWCSTWAPLRRRASLPFAAALLATAGACAVVVYLYLPWAASRGAFPGLGRPAHARALLVAPVGPPVPGVPHSVRRERPHGGGRPRARALPRVRPALVPGGAGALRRTVSSGSCVTTARCSPRWRCSSASTSSTRSRTRSPRTRTRTTCPRSWRSRWRPASEPPRCSRA